MTHAALRPVLAAAAGLVLAALSTHAGAISPAEVLAASAPADWRRPADADLMVMDLPGGRRVVIELASVLVPRHASELQRRAAAGWFDSLAIVRVQDNYVVQWGDAAGGPPLPPGVERQLPAEIEFPRLPAGHFLALPDPDTYAARVGLFEGWPVAGEAGVDGAPEGPWWLVHCYGMVGAGRETGLDSGSTGELYAVIGHAPRALDRNITLVGRILAGIEHLSALPRGTAAMGFHERDEARTPLGRVRLAADLPAAERPALQVLRTDSASYAHWLQARRHRKDEFFERPAGRVDLCNALPPVRSLPAPTTARPPPSR
ncbi:MAG: hypothetical protein RL026_2021 [Pseudomonadota bacterium]|jgi:peptidylprolyl isomerase